MPGRPWAIRLTAVAELAWHVGDVVRKLRQKKGWTQKELAKAAHVHHNTIVRLEDGDEGVQGRTLKQVADALGVSRQRLWALVPQEQETPTTTAATSVEGVTFRYAGPERRQADHGPPPGIQERRRGA